MKKVSAGNYIEDYLGFTVCVYGMHTEGQSLTAKREGRFSHWGWSISRDGETFAQDAGWGSKARAREIARKAVDRRNKGD